MVKRLVLILLCLSVAGCRSTGHAQPGSGRSPSLKAVYFVREQGELPADDLQAHPEVKVVSTFEELKKHADQKIAIWIDRNVTPFDPEQEEWINAAPQAYYPLVLIGTSDTLYSFRDLLRLRSFMGPAIYPGRDAPGFSVILRERPVNPATALVDIPFIHGYDQQPTVQSILKITNDFLEGKRRPTPISTLPKPPIEVATSTTRQIILYDEEPGNGFPNDAAKINWVALGGNI